jgi:hypothetical protein
MSCQTHTSKSSSQLLLEEDSVETDLREDQGGTIEKDTEVLRLPEEHLRTLILTSEVRLLLLMELPLPREDSEEEEEEDSEEEEEDSEEEAEEEEDLMPLKQIIKNTKTKYKSKNAILFENLPSNNNE